MYLHIHLLKIIINLNCIQKSPQKWEGMYVNKKKSIRKKNKNLLFNGFKKDDGLDESMFDSWKTELQKDLPDFWESMTNHK